MINLETELKNTFTFSKTTENQIDFSLTLPKSLTYFVGHFPQFPVLPAVGLIDISIYLTRQLQPQLNQCHLKKIKYLKIKSPLGPDQKIKIQILQDDQNSFTVLWNTDEAKAIAELNFVFDL